MSNNYAVGSRVLLRVVLAVLFTISGLASCGGGGGSTTVSSSVITTTSPTVTLTAAPSSIASGTTSVITWSSTNSNSCTSSGGGGTGTTGSFTTPSLTTTTTYTVTCTGAGGTANQSTTVTVVTAAPVVTLTATPSSIQYGATSHITWSSTNSTSCTSSGGGGTGTTGSFTTPSLTTTTTYTVTCTGPAGSASQSTTVTVAGPPPTVTLTATPSSIASGGTAVITWSSTNSASCTSSGGGGTGTTGSFTTPSLTTTTTYTVTCTGAGGTASQSATVTVAATQAPIVTLSAAPSSIASGGNAVITWSSTNSTSCTSSGGGGTGIAGSFTTPALTTTTNYTVTCTGPGGSASQSTTVTVAGSACSTTGATTAISLSNVPSRLSGVAPLSVFFDATGTTATGTTRPFHDLEYRWNFGENSVALAALPGGANWTNGSTKGSRNLATGPEAAHVFETPGTYTVSLEVTDGTSTVANSCTQIVVQDPDVVFAGTNTTCVGATSNPVQGQGGCPAGANTTVQPNFQAAIASYALTGRRVLFRRGDTFTVGATSARIISTGPGIVGAFGAGVKPRVQMTGNASILQMSSGTTAGIKDWRVMDLELDGLSASTSEGIQGNGNINQLTILRVNVHNVHIGFDFSGSILLWYTPAHPVYDQLSIVDSSMLQAIGGSAGYGVFLCVKNLAFLGNVVDDTTSAEHVLRISYLGRGIVSNSTLAHAALTKEIVKLHGPTWVGGAQPNAIFGNGYTEKVIFSDNKFVGGINPWSMAMGAQNAQSDERSRNIIVERNWFTAGTGTQTDIVLMSVDTTVRNNIFDRTGSRGYESIFIQQWGPQLAAPPPDNERIYNNTFYSGSTTAFVAVHLDPTAGNANVSIINNLGSAPLATNPVMISGTSTGLIQSNNLLNNTPSALFVSATPVNPTDFGLSVSSPARDKGASGVSAVPVFSDFLLCYTCRPQSGVPGVIDIGAIEGP